MDDFDTNQSLLLRALEDALGRRGWRVVDRTVLRHVDPREAFEYGYWLIERSTRASAIKLIFFADRAYGDCSFGGNAIPNSIASCAVEHSEVELDFWKKGKRLYRDAWSQDIEVFLDQLDQIERGEIQRSK